MTLEFGKLLSAEYSFPLRFGSAVTTEVLLWCAEDRRRYASQVLRVFLTGESRRRSRDWRNGAMRRRPLALIYALSTDALTLLCMSCSLVQSAHAFTVL